MSFIPSHFRHAGVLALSLAALAISVFAVRPEAQQGGAADAPAPPMINKSSDPLLQSFRFRSIGPASLVAFAINSSSMLTVVRMI